MSGHRDPHDPSHQGRTEPTLGDLDHLDSPRPNAPDGLPNVTIDPDRRRSAPNKTKRPRRRGWLIPVLLIVVIGAAAALWLNQNHLRGMLANTDLNDVLNRAQTALQQGHLDGSDGTSARELFEQANALEPDNDRAHQGLHQVGMAEVARADAALQAGKLDDADQALAIARELLGGGSDVDRLTQQIATARNATGQIDTLIGQAQQAFTDGKLDGGDGAGALYQRALATDPTNAVARHGLDQVGGALADQARKALDANDRAGAGIIIDRLAALLPNYGDLPSLRTAQTQLQQQDTGALADTLKQGEDALRAGRISGAGDDTALAHFKAALAIDPDNAEAKAGLGQVAEALIVQANAALDGGDAAQARQLLDQAAVLAPKSADLLASRARLGQGGAADTSQGVSSDDQDTSTVTPVNLTPQQSAQIDRMVQQAQIAASRGDIMSPPGNCAYDLYRSALAIDGNNVAARAGLQGLSSLVGQQFQQALRDGDLVKASDLLGTLGNLSPGDAGQVQLQERLAGAWLDKAEQQLNSGDRSGAAQALQQARKLAPNQPRLQQLSLRMQGGT
ncbi:MAG: hypothetical protein WA777_07190 [Rhodanobacter sp.]